MGGGKGGGGEEGDGEEGDGEGGSSATGGWPSTDSTYGAHAAESVCAGHAASRAVVRLPTAHVYIERLSVSTIAVTLTVGTTQLVPLHVGTHRTPLRFQARFV